MGSLVSSECLTRSEDSETNGALVDFLLHPTRPTFLPVLNFRFFTVHFHVHFDLLVTRSVAPQSLVRSKHLVARVTFVPSSYSVLAKFHRLLRFLALLECFVFLLVFLLFLFLLLVLIFHLHELRLVLMSLPFVPRKQHQTKRHVFLGSCFGDRARRFVIHPRFCLTLLLHQGFMFGSENLLLDAGGGIVVSIIIMIIIIIIIAAINIIIIIVIPWPFGSFTSWVALG
ncbi:hypothetical protein V8G54_020113 [Vigna mungo]|uniref:Uncharacterized protein n=1 Tax=Vigna mungo TaxID=3915 RepID=A0AAQ3RUE0_VIGMU